MSERFEEDRHAEGQHEEVRTALVETQESEAPTPTTSSETLPLLATGEDGKPLAWSIGEDKARDMAHAAKPRKDAAAEMRDAAALLDGTQEGLDKVYLGKTFSEGGQATGAHPALSRLDELSNGEQLGSSELSRSEARRELYDRTGPGITEVSSQELREQLDRESKQLDDRAEAVADWAGILDDHPVSEAYKANHENVDFTPEALMATEASLRKDISIIAQKEKALKEVKPIHAFQGFDRNRSSEDYDYDALQDGNGMYDLADRVGYTLGPGYKHQLLRQWEKLAAKEGVTLEEMKKFYTEQYRIHVIQPIQNRVSMVKSVLEDVKSGRAST
jgi:hypothetical protein